MITANRADPNTTDFPANRIKELQQLFAEFRKSYLPTDDAQAYRSALADARVVAQRNVAALLAAAPKEALLPERVLLTLLPHADTVNNRWRGAWLHPTAAISGDLRTWYEAAGWTEAEAWPAIAEALLGFVRQAISDPAHLADACATWAALPYTTGFQSGLLTPILNALRPADYTLLNNRTRDALNYFTDNAFSQAITDYPAANATLQALLAMVAQHTRGKAVAAVALADQFLLFAGWLRSVKGFSFRTPRYWLLAVNGDPWIWREFCEGNIVAVGGPDAWDELGDLTEVTRREFYRRRDSLIAEHPEWTKRSAEPIWRFARQMNEGDQVLVHHGRNVLGVGVVTGGYYYVADVPLGHRRPVEWLDRTLRRHAGTGNNRDLSAVDPDHFAQLMAAPPQEDESSPWEQPPVPTESNGGESVPDQPMPDFVRVLPAMIDLLQALGGQARAGEVIDALVDRLSVGDMEGSRNGAAPSPTQVNRLRRQIYRARHYLLRAGLLSTPSHGVWQLTARGRTTALSDGDAQRLYAEIEYQQNLTESLEAAGDTIRRLAETRVPYTTSQSPDSSYQSSVISHQPLVAVPQSPITNDQSSISLHPYPLTDVAAATFLPEPELARWVQAIERKGQAIFYGPPGVGKTFLAEQLARHLAGASAEGAGDGGFVETVQFHAAYAYEDFVQGMRPQADANGGLTYPIIPGRFLRFCEAAAGVQGRCTLIIDEINRADLARVFGELMYLLEYRERSVRLAADGRNFAIPANVRIIGTMNTADRSIALVDYALRRRFAFIALGPDWEVLRRFHRAQSTDATLVESLIGLVQRVNRQISDPQYAIGHSFFMRADLAAVLPDIWQLEIEPYLEEVLFDQPEGVDLLRWTRVQGEVNFVNRKS